MDRIIRGTLLLGLALSAINNTALGRGRDSDPEDRRADVEDIEEERSLRERLEERAGSLKEGARKHADRLKEGLSRLKKEANLSRLKEEAGHHLRRAKNKAQDTLEDLGTEASRALKYRDRDPGLLERGADATEDLARKTKRASRDVEEEASYQGRRLKRSLTE